MSQTAEFTHSVTTDGPAKGMKFSMRRRPDAPVADGVPLVVALPGGTYTSVYFDVPGQSLLDTAESIGVPVIAVDRPGYRESTKVEASGSIIAANAEVLDHLIGELWDSYGNGAPGVVVIGHSIGGAVTTAIAARHPAWPLLGIAVSGCLVRVPKESGAAWAALPDLEFVELPGPVDDVADLLPAHEIATVEDRQAGHVLEGRAGQVVVLADPADRRVGVAAGKQRVARERHAGTTLTSTQRWSSAVTS